MVVLSGISLAGAVGLVIDEFEDGPILVSGGFGIGVPEGSPQFGTASASVVGDTRVIEVAVTDPGAGRTHAQVDPTAAFIQGTLDVANNVPPSAVTLTYDADGAGLGSTGDDDFSPFTQFEVVFDYLQLDGGSLNAMVKVIDGLANEDQVSIELTEDIGTPEVGDDTSYFFAFSDFSGIQWSDLEVIEVMFNTGPDQNIDFRVEAIRAVPEPSAAGLLLLTAGMMIVCFRRRDR